MFQSFCSLEMKCLYSKYTTLSTQGFVGLCIRVAVHTLSETMTAVCKVLKDFGAYQLLGYQNLFGRLQFLHLILQRHSCI